MTYERLKELRALAKNWTRASTSDNGNRLYSPVSAASAGEALNEALDEIERLLVDEAGEMDWLQ